MRETLQVISLNSNSLDVYQRGSCEWARYGNIALIKAPFTGVVRHGDVSYMVRVLQGKDAVIGTFHITGREISMPIDSNTGRRSLLFSNL